MFWTKYIPNTTWLQKQKQANKNFLQVTVIIRNGFSLTFIFAYTYKIYPDIVFWEGKKCTSEMTSISFTVEL